MADNAHQTGHRSRLRKRFLDSDGAALADYEMLEMLLFAAKPRGDTKPLAKALIKQFGSFAAVVQETPEKLRTVEGIGDAAIASIKMVESAATLLLQEEIQKGPVIGSWSSLLDYCKLAMAHKKIEQFRVLYLNRKNTLIKDEIVQEGTIDHTPVYPREIVKRAIDLSASSLILVHNHPSGDPSPSKADIDMTNAIVEAARLLEIRIHDHLIIANSGHYSFKSHGLI